MPSDYRGYLIAAHPANPSDADRFAVMMMINHTPDYSFAVQINRIAENHDFTTICENLGISLDTQDPVYHGGNIGMGRVHVIHSLDWEGLTTIPLTDDIGVTNDISILAAISTGEGPDFYRACAGHHVWTQGKFNYQIDPRNYPSDEKIRWEAVPATLENTFINDGIVQWKQVLEESACFQVSTWF